MHFCRIFACGRLCTGCSRNGAVHCSFAEHFKAATLGRSCWWILPELRTNYLNVSAEFLVVKGYVQSAALRKELRIAPCVERIKTATLRRSTWYILPVFETIYLNVTFPPNICWYKVKYKALYERRYSLLLA